MTLRLVFVVTVVGGGGGGGGGGCVSAGVCWSLPAGDFYETGSGNNKTQLCSMRLWTELHDARCLAAPPTAPAAPDTVAIGIDKTQICHMTLLQGFLRRHGAQAAASAAETGCCYHCCHGYQWDQNQSDAPFIYKQSILYQMVKYKVVFN